MEPILELPDPLVVQQIREALALRKYQEAMADAQFGPGAIVDCEA